MKSTTNILKREEGATLVIALVMLVLLTMLGATISNQTQVEILVAGNYKNSKTAFHHADSGIYTTPKVIVASIEGDGDVSGINYLGSANTFYRELMGFDAYDTARDIRFTMSGFNIDVDVNRTRVQNIAGGGVEFASGAEGIGVGSAGGVAVFYDIDSLGNGPGDSQSNIVSGYRLVIGVVGGL